MDIQIILQGVGGAKELVASVMEEIARKKSGDEGRG